MAIDVPQSGSEQAKPASEKRIVKLKHLNGTVKEVDLNIFVNKTFKDIKQALYPEEMQLKKLVRIIFRGRVITDEEKINDI